jgi:ferritin-like metal-binding protein YciE
MRAAHPVMTSKERNLRGFIWLPSATRPWFGSCARPPALSTNAEHGPDAANKAITACWEVDATPAQHGALEQHARSRVSPAEDARLSPPPSRNNEEFHMGLFSKDIATMDDLFVHMMRDIYYAEQQIVKSLPKMIEKASDPKLKEAFKSHLTETKNHVKRLEDVFHMRGVEAKGIDCPAIDGIIEEAEDIMGEADNKAVMDAALIAAAQAVEHYEMTRYGSLIAWAKQLNRNDCADLLAKTLDEEKAADQKLTHIAMGNVNLKAA